MPLPYCCKANFCIPGNGSSAFWPFSCFCATLLLYAIHRIIGLNTIPDIEASERFRVIHQFKSHIKIYALLAGIGSLVLYFFLPLNVQLALVIPTLISLGYAIPFLDGQRLRDFDLIKIYLIAGVWTWITVVLPALDAQELFQLENLFL